jgi:hypothetical protein
MHSVAASFVILPGYSQSQKQQASLHSRLRERLSILTSMWHTILISQSGRQGNGVEIRYHYSIKCCRCWSSGGSFTAPRLAWPGLAHSRYCRISDYTVSVVLARPLAYRDHKAAIAPIRRGSQSWKRVQPQIAFLLLSACICGRSSQAFTSTLLIHG